MDYKRREEIFSKEALSIKDVMELTGKPYATSAEIIRNMKLKIKSDRLGIDGMIHILDYFKAMGIDPKNPGDRYVKPLDADADGAANNRILTSPQTRRSVCL